MKAHVTVTSKSGVAALLAVFFLLQMTFAGGFTATALTADDCAPTGGDVTWAEWWEGTRHRGARLVFDGRWQEARTMHGQWLAYETLPPEAPISGWFQIGRPLPFQDWAGLPQTANRQARLAATLEPKLLEHFLGVIRGIHYDMGLFAVSEPHPWNIVGLTGLYRVFAAEHKGRVLHATAIAAEEGCVAVYAVFGAKDGHQVIGQELASLASTVRLQRYEPIPPLDPLPNKSPERVPFEDFRRRLGLD